MTSLDHMEITRCNVFNWQKDCASTIISLLAKLNDFRIKFINIYAPTSLTERKESFDILLEYFYPEVIKLRLEISIVLKAQLINFGGNFSPFAKLKKFSSTHHISDVLRNNTKV